MTDIEWFHARLVDIWGDQKLAKDELAAKLSEEYQRGFNDAMALLDRSRK